MQMVPTNGRMQMAYFQWGNDMTIDNGLIDQDHQLLVEQVNTLHTATSQGRGHEVVGPLLEAIIRDTRSHIHHEEQQMEALGYPHLAEHRQGHQRFMADLENLRVRYQAGAITVAAQLSWLLRDWLSVHIHRLDKELARFIRQQQRQNRPLASVALTHH